MAGLFAAVPVQSIALERLAGFKAADTTRSDGIDQNSIRAGQIRDVLKRIKLPPGFNITLYAMVPGARHMAVGPKDVAIFVGTTGKGVWAVTDRNRDRIADTVKQFALPIKFVLPNGPCITANGDLYIAEQNRVLVFPAAEFLYQSPKLEAFVLVPQGQLVPRSEQSRGHSARVCAIGPDDKIYITLGQPYNVSPPEKAEIYARTGIGGIIRMNRDGTDREVFATGIRNSVGIDIDQASGDVWFTDNQVDGMGDLIPPGELNRAAAPGGHFGFPWFGGGSTRTHEYLDSELPANTIAPQVEMDAHATDLGLLIYTGSQFPPDYAGAIFSAQHGSWDRTDPIGARVMVTFRGDDGNASSTEVFAAGWLDEPRGRYLGRPVDIAQLPDGSILVSDDQAGAVYRISFGE